MTDVIVAIVLAVIIGSAVAYMVRAKKRGVKCIGCPAGGSCSAGKVRRKRLEGAVIGEKTMKITGMHCQHCVANVARALDQIDGVRADVSLEEGKAVVAYDRQVTEEILRDAVEKIGYKVTDIS